MFQNIFSRPHRHLQSFSAFKYYSTISPVPLEQFDTPELDCTRPRDQSHQRDRITRKPAGSEDCLHLNVYAPVKSSSQPLPVMVWIHGGGFLFGHGQTFLPVSILSEDVIVVSINYRLGFFGFAYLPEAGIWGNAGLKDQRQALAWIHENIANFNGDPNNVTLFGMSAGSACIGLHTLTSHAHKFFQKAVMHGGVANSEWLFQRQPREKTYQMCNLLGCQSKDPNEMLKFIQSPGKVSPKAVQKNTRYLVTPDALRRGPPFPLGPVLEDSSSPDAFINTPVLELMQRPDTLAMPTIVAYNTGEGLTFLKHQVLEVVDEDLARFVPRNIPLPYDHPELKMLVQKVREFYFGGERITQKHLQNLTDLLSDYHIVCDIHQATKFQAIHQPRATLYALRFDYEGDRDFFKKMNKLEHLYGSCHGDEINYLLQYVGEDMSTFSESDLQAPKRLSALWTNFARYGNPTPKNSDIAKELGIVWTPVKRPLGGEDCKLDYFIFDRQCSMQQDPDKDRIQFWQNIYKKYKMQDYSVLNATD